MTDTDHIYISLLQQILTEGEQVNTRNSVTTSHFNLPNITFTEFPLVTLRKTAIKKAIREFEWFLSGDSKCPEELLDWWDGQLAGNSYLFSGYGEQFRNFGRNYGHDNYNGFNQIKFILASLKTNPNSRRLLISLWSPEEMANITKINNNPNTPTCCHSIIIQFFVRQGKLHMKTYQRSADMLLGVPHNWVQSWAFLLYLAYHTNLQVGSMTWMWGDAHIYMEESHTEATHMMIDDWAYSGGQINQSNVTLDYKPTQAKLDSNNVPIFRAEDFKVLGEVPEPVVTHKIRLI